MNGYIRNIQMIMKLQRERETGEERVQCVRVCVRVCVCVFACVSLCVCVCV
jgi:hypothetical protein